jgi:hypothetical protein
MYQIIIREEVKELDYNGKERDTLKEIYSQIKEKLDIPKLVIVINLSEIEEK